MKTPEERAAKTAEKIALAKRWVNDGVQGLFVAEIANERDGGVSPSTLSSTIDSVAQGLTVRGDQDEHIQSLVNLLVIRDMLPGKTKVVDLL